MANAINEQLEQAVLSSIRQGRWLAEGWEEVGIRPAHNLRPFLPQLLQRLKDGDPLAINDENALDLMVVEIRTALNELKPGYGDLAMRIDTSEHLIFDENRERLRQLAERWKSFQRIRRQVRDLQAAMRQLKLALRRV
ncbi:hypothetical protein [Leisingera aquimarina]|uniref:hypothetical protein n=1 Tax=Leisingera aquimarina TaxID=476529 RepID=UPI000488CE96|nr:hypothetical protein [Leisingera aquimarina]